MKKKTQDINFVRLTGALVSNPKVGFWHDILMTRFSLMVRNDQKKQQDTIEISCFGKWAELSGKVYRKGDRVKVAGRFKAIRYYNKTAGLMESNIIIIASMITPLSLSREVISYRYKRWHYVDEIEVKKAFYITIDTRVELIPRPIKRLLFFSKILQVETYWLYYCLKRRWEQRKKDKSKEVDEASQAQLDRISRQIR